MLALCPVLLCPVLSYPVSFESSLLTSLKGVAAAQGACVRQYTVKSGDTCNSIGAAQGASTYVRLSNIFITSTHSLECSGIKSWPLTTPPLTTAAAILCQTNLSAWVPKAPTAQPRMSSILSSNQGTDLISFHSYVVKPGDTCMGIEATHGINATQLYVSSLDSQGF